MCLNEQRDVGVVARGGGDQAILSELNGTIDFISVGKELINSAGVRVAYTLKSSLEKPEISFGQEAAMQGQNIFLGPSKAPDKK
mmetsp:Transcript_20891/g.37945  ORF Transcript_20891/g.37945 Transcript_20891/m.37945 type:complete len:84 (+) Transcript_20891:739-990(+)